MNPPNKCYTCGWSNAHALGCPQKHKTPPRDSYLIPTHAPKPVKLVYVDPPVNAHAHPDVPPPDLANPLKPLDGHKTIGNTVLPLESRIDVPAFSTIMISTQPQIACRLLRFWVDEHLAPHFQILDIRVGCMSLLLTGERVHASHFSIARRDDYHLATEFGETCNPSQCVTINVTNTDRTPHPFRALFEVLTVPVATPIVGWDI